MASTTFIQVCRGSFLHIVNRKNLCGVENSVFRLFHLIGRQFAQPATKRKVQKRKADKPRYQRADDDTEFGIIKQFDGMGICCAERQVGDKD